MRCSARVLVSLLAMTLIGPSLAAAEGTDEPIVLYRSRDIRTLDQLELERFQRIEHPQRLQEVTDEIRLHQAIRASLKRQIADFRRFKTNAFVWTLEQLQLQLLDAEMSLKRLRREQLLLQYYGPEEIRLRKQQLEQST